MRFMTRQRRRTPQVIIVSLIDVLLVVLIFLMVSTTFKEDKPGALKIALPEAKAAQPGSSDAKPFVVLVATNFPYFFIGDRPMTPDRLQSELEAAVKRDPRLKLDVRADKQAPVGEMVKVLDIAKLVKVASINVVVEKAKR
jgi:biopolymer transport protein ExbD